MKKLGLILLFTIAAIGLNAQVIRPLVGVDIKSIATTDTLPVETSGYDATTDGINTNQLNAIYTRYTDAEVLETAQDLTASYADFGAEIDMRGFNRIGLFIVTDVNNSEDVDLKVLGKSTAGGTFEYEIDGTDVVRIWSGTGTDAAIYYEFDVGTIPFIQLQIKAGTVGATAGDLTADINKKWRD